MYGESVDEHAAMNYEEEEQNQGLEEDVVDRASASHDEEADGVSKPNQQQQGMPNNNNSGRLYCSYCRDGCGCSFWTTLTVILHIIILVTAILCMIPMGVMTSVIRSYTSGIVTFIWLIYCCIMLVANVTYAVLHRFNKIKKNEDEENIGIGSSYHVPNLCSKTGCLCVGNDESTKCCKKVPCSVVVTLLLIIEGILLLTPIFASSSSYNSLNNGAIEQTFLPTNNDDDAPSSLLLPNPPRHTSFSFGQYMLPGSFSQFGGHTNNNANAVKTFRYKDGCKPECELDIHVPVVADDDMLGIIGYPVIFHVHGGGWDYGDKSKPLIPITYWLDRNYAFVSIQYRFPSQTPGGATIFEQLDDVQDAFDYMTTIGPEHGLDTSRVLFFGDSAGGHLACTVAYRSGDPRIFGVMNLYGATEWSYYMNDGGGGMLESLFDGVLPDNPDGDDYTNASCSTYATADSAPLLTMHGTWDTLVPYSVSQHLHSIVNALGVSNLLVEVPLAEHVLEAGFYSIGGQMSVYAMERFAAYTLLGRI